MSTLAVLAARNEAGYIHTTLRSLIGEGLEVVLIDNGSIDGTRELAEPFLGGGLIAICDLPWHGEMNLTKQLEAKQAIFAASSHEWHVHVDADEWLRANVELPLGTFLEREVSADYLVVNFLQYVFLPPLGVDMWGQDYRRIATRYYHIATRPRRHMRAWRRAVDGRILENGGHVVAGIPVEQIYPDNQTLRHYIGLSWSQAISRRADRRFAPADLSKGWHANRVDMHAARPVVDSPLVHEAIPWDTRLLDSSTPSRFQFWERGFERSDKDDSGGPRATSSELSGDPVYPAAIRSLMADAGATSQSVPARRIDATRVTPKPGSRPSRWREPVRRMAAILRHREGRRTAPTRDSGDSPTQT